MLRGGRLWRAGGFDRVQGDNAFIWMPDRPMSKLVYNTNPQSRGRIVHWLMEELGDPYETQWVDFGPPMIDPEHLAINPMGKEPALRHGGAVVTAAAAIFAYLAVAFPDKGLIPPPGDSARAAIFRWMFFAAGSVEQAVVARALTWEVPEGSSGRTDSADCACAALRTARNHDPPTAVPKCSETSRWQRCTHRGSRHREPGPAVPLLPAGSGSLRLQQ